MNNGKLGDFYEKLPQYSEIDEAVLGQYFTPSEDPLLLGMVQDNIKYIMSTSSITGFLSQIAYALTNFSHPNFSGLTSVYDKEPLKFMVSQRKPTGVYLRKVKDAKNVWAVDSD